MFVIGENIRAASLMVGSMLLYTLNDTCLKAVGEALPVFQSIFLRSILVAVIFSGFFYFGGLYRIRIKPTDFKLLFLRATAEIASTFFFISALFKMPIANVVAIIQVLPLTVSLAAIFFLNERVGWRRILAILIGFIGVLLIIKPGASDFNYYSSYALLAVVFVTMREIVTRKLSTEVPSSFVATTTAVTVFIFSGLGALSVNWMPVSFNNMVNLFAASTFLAGGYLFSVLAIRKGEIGFVAPFRYTSLLAALFLGFFIFGEWPDSLTLLGALIILTAGIFSLYRERNAGLLNQGK
jgi:S-adenosylmethionine uptake transporter